MSPSLGRYCLIAFLMMELILTIATIVLGRQADEITRTRLNGSSERAEHILVSQVQTLIKENHRVAQRLARHPDIIACFNACDTAALERLIRATTDGATLRLIAAGPTHQHVELSINDRSASPPATPTLAAVRTTLAVSEPVRGPGGMSLGHLVLEREAPDLVRLFDLVRLPEAYVELQQKESSGHLAVLVQRGNEQLKQTRPAELTSLEGTPWQLAVWSLDRPLTHPTTSRMTIWAIASTALAIVVLAFYLILRRVIREDTELMVTFFADMRQMRLRRRYPIRLKELREPFELMYRLGKLLIGKQKQVADDASVDHLSQVHNRRAFEAKQHELYQSMEHGWTHSLLILDVDNFKQVNDTFGHDAGDMLIVEFGKALKDNLRSSDFIARLGGDEFCVLFPNTPLKRAEELAQRLRERMTKEVELAPGVRHTLRWSGGLTQFLSTDNRENEALSRADSALLDAKKMGRNRTQVAA